MTKLEFITALHKACPAFMRDIKSYVDFTVANNLRVPLPDETPNGLTEDEFCNKWPRASQLMSDKLAAEVVAPCLRDRLPDFRSQGGLATLEILDIAKAANVELDPYFSNLEKVRAEEEDMKKFPDFYEKLGIMPPKVSLISLLENSEAKKYYRQIGGWDLFSKVAMVIPIYPETNRDDIDWEVIEQLKKRFYGQSYRAKPDQYQKIIKVFQAGQLLEEKAGKEERAYKSWQEVADSVGLELSTVRYIYGRAHEIVFGLPAKKRHYGVEQEVVIPELPKDIPDDPGPKLREQLKDEIAEYKTAFNKFRDEDDREKCHRCQRLVASSSGKYMPHDNRPDDEIFLCNNCLNYSS